MDIDQERKFMKAAIAASRSSYHDPTGAVPRVGAIAVFDNEIKGVAYRNFETGRHAEFLLLENRERPLPSLAGATIYTTLEPCTERGSTRDGEKKTPCVDLLIGRKVSRVVIGMLDPNPIVRGLGFRKLRAANIQTDVFPYDLMAEIEDMNRDFIRSMENNPIHHVIQKIAVSSVRSNKLDIQRAAVQRVLEDSEHKLKRIQHGQVPIDGKEHGYFDRWLAVGERCTDSEQVKAYIRVSAFDPRNLLQDSWFTRFYDRLQQLVASNKLAIRYIFLIREKNPVADTRKFLDRYAAFAQDVRIVEERGARLSQSQLQPSIVLFERQRVAFTHDRRDSGEFLGADEWIFEENYARLDKQFREIELASKPYKHPDKNLL